MFVAFLYGDSFTYNDIPYMVVMTYFHRTQSDEPIKLLRYSIVWCSGFERY